MTSFLIRHASAGRLSDWRGDDRDRPLDATGIVQAEELAASLLAAGARRAVSSPYLRCVQTLEPFAAAAGRDVETDERLAEGSGRAALELLLEDGVAVCTHGDVIFALLGHGLQPAGVVRFRAGRPA